MTMMLVQTKKPQVSKLESLAKFEIKKIKIKITQADGPEKSICCSSRVWNCMGKVGKRSLA